MGALHIKFYAPRILKESILQTHPYTPLPGKLNNLYIQPESSATLKSSSHPPPYRVWGSGAKKYLFLWKSQQLRSYDLSRHLDPKETVASFYIRGCSNPTILTTQTLDHKGINKSVVQCCVTIIIMSLIVRVPVKIPCLGLVSELRRLGCRG